ncbi:MAG TPA: complex I NDUFA9 subunit family protein [Rhodospirillales bacterium]|nr:complex I NDUFA9 subunit family protein [Rhodospirillales bacterium]
MERRIVTVFGGSGFVGRYVVRRMATDNWIVRVAVRDPEKAQFLKVAGDPGQVVPLAAEVTDAASVARATDGVGAVVNLVGILYERGRRTFQRIHVEGAANVARAAHAAGVERLVQMSAIGADADSPAAYGRTKAAGEQAAAEAFAGATVLRPSVVFGPEDDFLNRFAQMARIMPVLPVFPTRFQPVWVGDVAEAVARVFADPTTAGNTYELGGPQVLSFEELMRLMLREIHRRRWLLPLPLGLAEVQAWFLEKLPVPPLTRDQVKLLGADNVVAPRASTLRDLGIEPTALEAIIPSYLDRYRPQAKRRPRLD